MRSLSMGEPRDPNIRRLPEPSLQELEDPPLRARADRGVCTAEVDLLLVGLELLLAVLLDIREDLLGQLELLVEVAGVRVVRVRADRELLLRLPLHDPLALRRVVVPLDDLLDQRRGRA